MVTNSWLDTCHEGTIDVGDLGLSRNVVDRYGSLVEHDPDWAIRMTAEIGRRVAWFRERKKMTVKALADRCAELGLPLGRVTITKLEGGHRQAITPAELMVLAAALGVPPIELLFAVGRQERVEALPGVRTTPWFAALWFTGEYNLWRADAKGFAMKSPQPGDESDVSLMRAHWDLLFQWRQRERAAVQAAKEMREQDAGPDSELGDRVTYRQIALGSTEDDLRRVRAEMRARGLILPVLSQGMEHLDEPWRPREILGLTPQGTVDITWESVDTTGDDPPRPAAIGELHVPAGEQVERLRRAEDAPGQPERTWLAQNAAEAKRRHDAGESLESIGEWLAESLPPGSVGDLASMAEITAGSLRAAGFLPASGRAREREGTVSPKREGD
jgi:hypothetical protein